MNPFEGFGVINKEWPMWQPGQGDQGRDGPALERLALWPCTAIFL